MELERIKMLTRKYLDAETSIKEEQELQEYYTSGNVDPQLEEYTPLFVYFKAQKEIELTEKEEQPVKRRKKGLYEWLAVAASIAIIGGILMFNNYDSDQQELAELGTYDDPELALQQTKDVLNMVSYYMNEGQESIGYVAQFGETTNKLIKNN